jgi:hypothetical protein
VLAAGAVVEPPRRGDAEHRRLDPRAAAGAGPAGRAIDRPRQAAGVDPLAQHSPRDGGELEQAAVADLRDGRERILLELPERLGAHDVADPGQHPLVEQQRTDGPVDRSCPAQVGGGVEPASEQIGAEPEAQVAAPAHLDPCRAEDDDVGGGRAHDVATAPLSGIGQPHPSVHAEVHVQAAAVRPVHEQVLAARLDRGNVRARQRPGGHRLADDRADPPRRENERVPLRHAAPAACAP